MADPRQKNRGDPVICCCNNVRKSEIVAAIAGGARSMATIFDATFAGCGPCGGTCQPEIAAILKQQLAAPSAASRGK
ncbi:MAG: (2Fe-2S)-binding protein [Deltaproteobacteria bacterium]|nr:(2Fe-2S)-binding protein [Deltaproteobacteria bacterium]